MCYNANVVLLKNYNVASLQRERILWKYSYGEVYYVHMNWLSGN